MARDAQPHRPSSNAGGIAALPPEVLTEAEVERVIAFPFAGRHAERDRALVDFHAHDRLPARRDRRAQHRRHRPRAPDRHPAHHQGRRPRPRAPEPTVSHCPGTASPGRDTQDTGRCFALAGASGSRRGRSSGSSSTACKRQESPNRLPPIRLGTPSPPGSTTRRATFGWSRPPCGTSTSRTTEVYAHVDPVRLRQAVNAPA